MRCLPYLKNLNTTGKITVYMLIILMISYEIVVTYNNHFERKKRSLRLQIICFKITESKSLAFNSPGQSLKASLCIGKFTEALFPNKKNKELVLFLILLPVSTFVSLVQNKLKHTMARNCQMQFNHEFVTQSQAKKYNSNYLAC